MYRLIKYSIVQRFYPTQQTGLPLPDRSSLENLEITPFKV